MSKLYPCVLQRLKLRSARVRSQIFCILQPIIIDPAGWKSNVQLKKGLLGHVSNLKSFHTLHTGCPL